jgi:Flp pilus assembly protein TadG
MASIRFGSQNAAAEIAKQPASKGGFPLMIHRWLGVVKDSAGASAIEFALLVPVFLLLAVGTAKFGMAINSYIMLTEAAADGARQLALSRGSTTPYTNAVSVIQSTASNLTVASLTITTAVNGTACTTDTACQTALNSASGRPAVVTATYPCDLEVVGVNFAPNCTLTSTTTEYVE